MKKLFTLLTFLFSLTLLAQDAPKGGEQQESVEQDQVTADAGVTCATYEGAGKDIEQSVVPTEGSEGAEK